jgi:hypothetical protein
MAMNCYDLTSPIYQALEIAVGYFVAAGDNALEANQKCIKHIVELFNRGERRPLMLANRAIEAVEREQQAERELKNVSLEAWFREHS